MDNEGNFRRGRHLSLHSTELFNSTADGVATAVNVMDELLVAKRRVSDSLRQFDFQSAFSILEQQFAAQESLWKHLDHGGRQLASSALDEMIQLYTSLALTSPFTQNGARSSTTREARTATRVYLATQLMKLQCSSKQMSYPFNLVPKRSFLNALKALTSPSDTPSRPEDYHNILDCNDDNNNDFIQTIAFDLPHAADLAYRMLQRLVTGVGVRTRQQTAYIAEEDFNRVLHAYVNLGRMDVARRIVTLQERTPHAPPLSPVTYSILLKGYGRFKDLKQVELVMEHALSNDVQPDTIMVNSLIDAYINCNAMDRAKTVFYQMTNNVTGEGAAMNWPKPNIRSYNTLLKGFANNPLLLPDAITLAKEMELRGLWDPVTTNTLVHAAVIARDFCLATRVLEEHTVVMTKNSNSNGVVDCQHRKTESKLHPNVPAYTELLDGYAKDNQLDKAVATLQLMRQRGVEPNEITYTCLLAGLGRGKKVKEARKMIAFMKREGIRPSHITYNALISALVTPAAKNNVSSTLDEAEVADEHVDEGLKLLRDMLQAGVRPNAVTISTLVRAFGNCNIPRVAEARLLVERMEQQNVINTTSCSIVTASLLQLHGRTRDLKSALEVFRKLSQPDVVAVNAFLDVCCRCGRVAVAFDTFEYYFHKKQALFALRPDVITYSILISATVRHATVESLKESERLYNDMVVKDGIMPDTALVDVLLKAAIQIGRTKSLPPQQVQFVARILHEAEQLDWAEGQLERRKRAVRAVFAEKLRGAWKKAAAMYQLSTSSEYDDNDDSEDDLFRKKGWNKVDSSFRVLGGASPAQSSRRNKPVVDKFLESKGWNNVDSSFRFI